MKCVREWHLFHALLMPWYSRREQELLLLLHYSVSRMEFKAQNDLQPHRKLRNISVMVNKKKSFQKLPSTRSTTTQKKAHHYQLNRLQFFTVEQKGRGEHKKKRAPTTTCFHHCFPYAIMPISTFARFSHCAICLASYLMIIMWKDQLITHRVSDLNEWNAENIERKIQLYAALWSWGDGKKMLPRQGANENKKKTISFVAEWIHLFLRLPSLLCFISSSYPRLKLVLFMKMPNVPFVGVIINCCAVNYNLKLRGKLKTAESGILRHCLTRRQ